MASITNQERAGYGIPPKGKKGYLFLEECTNKKDSKEVELDTKTPGGEICTQCGGTPSGSTGKTCNPTLKPLF